MYSSVTYNIHTRKFFEVLTNFKETMHFVHLSLETKRVKAKHFISAMHTARNHLHILRLALNL